MMLVRLSRDEIERILESLKAVAWTPTYEKDVAKLVRKLENITR
jgi:hypothetical protein